MKTFKKKSRVLFVSSEVYPFAKSGGLADVSFGLPKAMSQMYAISIIMPMYSFIDKDRFDIRKMGISFEISLGKKKHLVKFFSTVYEGVECYFVDTPILSNKKSLYGTPENGYKDNDLRFGLFSKAVVAFAKQNPYDLLHLNDWQSALCALLVKEDNSIKTKTVYTIHNLAYQGVFEKKSLSRLGLSSNYFCMESLEFYGDINFMKAGITYADALTTVSPNYAKEILTPEFGCGLEGFLLKHHNKITGILNGIDTSSFSPKTDPFLECNYDSKTYNKKIKNKQAYLKEIGMKNKKRALFIFIGRFAWQKGINLLIEELEKITKMKLNIAILGDGESQYSTRIKAISSKHKNIDFHFGYDEELSHRMYAAADFMLMPSLFEPCGLNQLISMNYGTMPIVSSVGGLKDSVHDLSAFGLRGVCGFGLNFNVKEPKTFLYAIEKALELYEDKKRLKKVNTHNMECDFSWSKGAASYALIYDSLLKKKQ